MRYFIPSVEAIRNVSADVFARQYEKRDCPGVIDANRCEDTGSLIIDFIDGSTVEFGNGEAVTVRYFTGRRDTHGEKIYSLSVLILSIESNARAWLAHIAFERNIRIMENIERERACQKEAA